MPALHESRHGGKGVDFGDHSGLSTGLKKPVGKEFTHHIRVPGDVQGSAASFVGSLVGAFALIVLSRTQIGETVG